MAELFSNFGEITWQMVVMWLIGALLIYLAIKKDMEPALLLPMGFGAILVNIPFFGRRRPRRCAEHPVRRRHRQRAVPADFVHRHRRDD